MAYSYIIKSVENSDGKFYIGYALLKDGVHIVGDCVMLPAAALADIASDGRTEYIHGQVASACKKFMVVQDVKVDVSVLVGVEISLEPVKYDTKAELTEKLGAVEIQ